MTAEMVAAHIPVGYMGDPCKGGSPLLAFLVSEQAHYINISMARSSLSAAALTFISVEPVCGIKTCMKTRLAGNLHKIACQPAAVFLYENEKDV